MDCKIELGAGTSQPPHAGEQTGPDNHPLGCPATWFAEGGTATGDRLLPVNLTISKVMRATKYM